MEVHPIVVGVVPTLMCPPSLVFLGYAPQSRPNNFNAARSQTRSQAPCWRCNA